jgi:hypothetical protein
LRKTRGTEINSLKTNKSVGAARTKGHQLQTAFWLSARAAKERDCRAHLEINAHQKFILLNARAAQIQSANAFPQGLI